MEWFYIKKLLLCSPSNPYKKRVSIGGAKSEEFVFTIYTSDGKVLVQYQEEKAEIKPVPDPAKAALDPKDIASMEQLFLNRIAFGAIPTCYLQSARLLF